MSPIVGRSSPEFEHTLRFTLVYLEIAATYMWQSWVYWCSIECFPQISLAISPLLLGTVSILWMWFLHDSLARKLLSQLWLKDCSCSKAIKTFYERLYIFMDWGLGRIKKVPTVFLSISCKTFICLSIVFLIYCQRAFDGCFCFFP